MIKIYFSLPEGEWHGGRSESLWTKEVELGGEVKVYEIDNIPFYTKAVSLKDVVMAINNRELGGLEFSGIVERGGNTTYRIISGSRDFEEYWPFFEKHDCLYENGGSAGTGDGRNLYAINVPAESDVDTIFRFMQDKESNKIWFFESGFYGHKKQSTSVS